MTTTIAGKSLTNVDIDPDGQHVRLNLKDGDGRPAALELPVECVNQLIMTLPRVLSRALRAQRQGDAARLVFPLGQWRLDRIAGDPRILLTLGTTDGFEVSFAVDALEIERMREMVSTARREAPLAIGLN